MNAVKSEVLEAVAEVLEDELEDRTPDEVHSVAVAVTERLTDLFDVEDDDEVEPPEGADEQ